VRCHEKDFEKGRTYRRGYQFVSYGGLVQLTITHGLNEVDDHLSQTLSKEDNANMIHTKIAEIVINYNTAEEA